MRKSLQVLCILLVSLCFFSCDGDAKIKLQNDGSVYFEFTGKIGDAFTDLMSSNLGYDGGFDVGAISTELKNAGFSNVNVGTEGDNINISFVDKKCQSYLFTSGLFYIENNELKVSITADKFLDFYNSCGEEIQMIFDLFLSPVLNDEIMDEEEYVDTISVAYGQNAGDEIDNSVIKFTIIDKKDNKKFRRIYMKSILCGEEFNF